MSILERIPKDLRRQMTSFLPKEIEQMLVLIMASEPHARTYTVLSILRRPGGRLAVHKIVKSLSDYSKSVHIIHSRGSDAIVDVARTIALLEFGTASVYMWVDILPVSKATHDLKDRDWAITGRLLRPERNEKRWELLGAMARSVFVHNLCTEE